MSKIIISPSILSADFANLERDIKKVENAGADWIHVDVMDGHFVPNITIGAPVVKSLRPVTNLTLDVHLMIENPEKYIEDFIKAGADIITFHYEAAQSCINFCPPKPGSTVITSSISSSGKYFKISSGDVFGLMDNPALTPFSFIFFIKSEIFSGKTAS